LVEKLAHIEPVTAAMNSVQIELRALAERLSTLERAQTGTSQGLTGLGSNSAAAFSELKSLASNLTEATAAIRAELARAKDDLTGIQAHATRDQALSSQIAESVRRLETVIAGTHSKGAAGESIVELILAKLPAEWQVRNFRLGGKFVEFGIRLPNGLILPIDSKWPASDLVERLADASTSDERETLKKEIETAVLQKAAEVRKYIDPTITTTFGMAVIPDSVYNVCPAAQADAFQINVVLASYSMFLPYLLLVFQTTLTNAETIDVQKLEAFLGAIQEAVRAIQDELDGRLSRAITMLMNSRDDMRAHVGKLGSSLTSVRISAPPPSSAALLPSPMSQPPSNSATAPDGRGTPDKEA
jgi:DNA recombination protein RmuC